MHLECDEKSDFADVALELATGTTRNGQTCAILGYKDIKLGRKDRPNQGLRYDKIHG